MQQALNLIPTTESNDELQFDVDSMAVRSEPIVLDVSLLRLISGGEELPHKGW